jgi:hypothetical protein
LNERSYENAMKKLSRRGWRTNEPGNLGAPEQPALLSKAREVLLEQGFTTGDLAGMTHLPPHRLDEILMGEGHPRVGITV